MKSKFYMQSKVKRKQAAKPTWHVDRLSLQPKASPPIRRLFEMNRIADYSQHQLKDRCTAMDSNKFVGAEPDCST